MGEGCVLLAAEWRKMLKLRSTMVSATDYCLQEPLQNTLGGSAACRSGRDRIVLRTVNVVGLPTSTGWCFRSSLVNYSGISIVVDYNNNRLNGIVLNCS